MMDSEVISRFHVVATASVADAVDEICGRRGYLDSSVKPRINDKKICGPAVTVLEGPTADFVPPQHALDLIDEAPSGSVICISTGSVSDMAVWGGLMTAGGIANRHEAALLDGGIRDIAKIRREYDFPVFSRAVSPGTTLGRFKTIASQVEIEIGGVMINPGDIVVGDIDGVVVVPKVQAEDVLVMVEEIDKRELEQAKLIIAERSLRKDLARYGRI
jgi:4-hydroxy-4-methyl-2-oxoglutarate aldolase